MRAEKIIEYFEDIGFEVKIEVHYIGPVFTVATAKLFPHLSPVLLVLIGEGIARKSIQDKHDDNIGRNISISRALNALWKKYNRKNRLVHSWYMG